MVAVCDRKSCLRLFDQWNIVLGARTLLGAPGIATRNKKLLGAPGLTTRSKDATISSYIVLQSV